MLFFLNWPNFMVWLPSALGIMDSMCTAIVCFKGCDVINLKINLIFLIKQKSQDKNWNILRTKRALKVKKKSIFHHFSRAFTVTNKFQFALPWFISWMILIGFLLGIWIKITFRGKFYKIKLLQKYFSRKIQTPAQQWHIMFLKLSQSRWNKTVLKHEKGFIFEIEIFCNFETERLSMTFLNNPGVKIWYP